MLERAEERAARVDRIVEAPRLEREQEAEIRVLHGDLPRLRGELSRLRHGRGVPGAPALVERERSRHDRDDESGRDAGEQRSEAAGAALRGSELALLRVAARLEEVALDIRELFAAGQFGRSRQARPAVEVGVLASGLLP